SGSSRSSRLGACGGGCRPFFLTEDLAADADELGGNGGRLLGWSGGLAASAVDAGALLHDMRRLVPDELSAAVAAGPVAAAVVGVRFCAERVRAAALFLVFVFALAAGGAFAATVQLVGDAVGNGVGLFLCRLVGVRHFAAAVLGAVGCVAVVRSGAATATATTATSVRRLLALDAGLLALHHVRELVGEQAIALLRARREL